jgi:hypothetical protein
LKSLSLSSVNYLSFYGWIIGSFRMKLQFYPLCLYAFNINVISTCSYIEYLLEVEKQMSALLKTTVYQCHHYPVYSIYENEKCANCSALIQFLWRILKKFFTSHDSADIDNGLFLKMTTFTFAHAQVVAERFKQIFSCKTWINYNPS